MMSDTDAEEIPTITLKELKRQIEQARASVDIPTEAARYIEQNVVPEPLRGAITKMLKTERPNIMHLCAQEAGWVKKED